MYHRNRTWGLCSGGEAWTLPKISPLLAVGALLLLELLFFILFLSSAVKVCMCCEVGSHQGLLLHALDVQSCCCAAVDNAHCAMFVTQNSVLGNESVQAPREPEVEEHARTSSFDETSLVLSFGNTVVSGSQAGLKRWASSTRGCCV